MCTVSYLPLGDNEFILTSSRDVPYARKSADAPKKFFENDVEITYPKDGEAGGTWIGKSEKNRLICLLNGGFEYHTSRASYKKSRGLIVKELLTADETLEGLEKIDLIGVEQFTLVIVDWNKDLKLYEFVWDGEKKHLKEKEQEPCIWSSSTLYDKGVKKMREDWFESWQETNDFNLESILKFHKTAGIGDPCIDVMMDRKLGGTVSISQLKREDDKISFDYYPIR